MRLECDSGETGAVGHLRSISLPSLCSSKARWSLSKLGEKSMESFFIFQDEPSEPNHDFDLHFSGAGFASDTLSLAI